MQSSKVPKENITECYSSLRELRENKQKPVMGKCMFWADKCAASPIGSHLLSRSWLKQVADGSQEFIRFRITIDDLMNKPRRIQAYHAGINKEILFPGFCQAHDNELFACLEKQEFAASREQLRALAYRSVCCEFCAKYQVVDCLSEKANTQLERALETNQQAPPLLAFQIEREKKCCIELLLKKHVLESKWHNQNNSLVSYVVRFAARPTVLVSTTVTPLITFTGQNLESRWDWISLSVIPCANGGWAVFTWDKSAPKNPSLFVKSFAKVPKQLQTVALLNFIFESSENFAIAPQWWESLELARCDDLFRRFGNSITRHFDKPPSNTLLLPKQPWVDWHPVEAGYV